MSFSVGGGQSCVVGNEAFTGESAGVHASPSCAASPTQAPARQTGQTWIPGRFGSRSPSRKSAEVSGRFRAAVAPVLQFMLPLAFAATEFTTHTLVGVLPGFGIGSGGPK